jgi:hypothetical protein
MDFEIQEMLGCVSDELVLEYCSLDIEDLSAAQTVLLQIKLMNMRTPVNKFSMSSNILRV